MKTINFNPKQTPIFRESGFYLENVENTKAAFKAEKTNRTEPESYIYSRYRNPTVVAAEKQMVDLEGSKWALLTESGMAAIDLALSLFQKGQNTGTWLFFSEIYGGTNSFADLVLIPRRGIDIKRFYAENGSYDLVRFEKTLEELKPSLIFFEAVSNPMLIVADAIEIIKIAKRKGCKVVIDNTFVTPVLWKPLDCGADIVIHSVTKYFAGHGNLTGGVVCGNDDDLEMAAIECRKWIGHMISPDDASRLSSFLKSFELRYEKQCENALRLAKILEQHPKIENVLYPGLEKHETHHNAKKLFGNKGFGAMITFDLKGKDKEEKKSAVDIFIKELEDKIPLIPTLGDCDTILMPVEAVWGDKFPLPGMIRFSVGIEKFELIENDVLNALNKI